MEKYAVIMGGGTGKRLWPLSRLHKPKQFLDLFGGGTLIENTIQRLDGVIERDHIIAVGSAKHMDMLIEYTKDMIPAENIIVEPMGRNTAPCIALVAMRLAENKDAVMCVLPSDHCVKDVEKFRAILNKGVEAAADSESIITVGIRPTFGSAEYGYIHLGDPADGVDGAYRVKHFIEKPNTELANKFFESGEYLWNAGIFIARAGVMLANIKKFLPNVHRNVKKAIAEMDAGNNDAAAKLYSEIENINIDFGVMEKCKDVLVFPGDFGWNDVGSFNAIHDILKNETGNAIISGCLLASQASNLTVYSKKKTVVASDVNNLLIIDMDDLLYICNIEDSEKTKQLVESLVAEGHSELE